MIATLPRIRETVALDIPLRFHPYLHPMVWGGHKLGSVLGKPLPTDELYGESWEISDHPSHRTVVADGPLAGKNLQELMQEHGSELLGASDPDYTAFPWLLKHLDAQDWLSIQVHPDDEAAARLWPGEIGKTEAWFILSAEPGSLVYAGLKHGVTPADLRRALENHTLADCLHHFTPRPGDCVFLPAGTVHAVGGGVLMFEIQQTSDATFRLYDWDRRDAEGRSRTLHIEPGMACINWQAGPVKPIPAEGYPQRPGDRAKPASQQLVDCAFFRIEYLCDNLPFSIDRAGCLRTVTVLQGRGKIDSKPVRAGDVLLLPAALNEVACEPNQSISLLVASLPTRR